MGEEFDQWVEQYRPITNPTGDSGFFVDDKCLMFETYGDDLAVVEKARRENPDKVWTVVEGDDNELYLGNGYHYVNRIGYFITETAHSGDPVNIKID